MAANALANSNNQKDMIDETNPSTVPPLKEEGEIDTINHSKSELSKHN